MTKKRARKIQFQKPVGSLTIGGWYDGDRSYLWIGRPDDGCLGIITGRRLRSIVKTMAKEFGYIKVREVKK